MVLIDCKSFHNSELEGQLCKRIKLTRLSFHVNILLIRFQFVLFFYVQDFHLGQVPEGAVGQFVDVVSVQLEHLQAGQTLEGETLHLTDTVPVQLTAGQTEEMHQTDHGKETVRQ